MSPQTRLAHGRRRARARWRVPVLAPADAERASELFRAQRRRGVLALVLIFALILGLPVVFALWPVLDSLRLLGIPVSWLTLAVLPYPAMTAIAQLQLRRAEKLEDR
ncbi:hypothetical protein [Amycolatopsis xylanica]|nr:hypothetical protein [Amycolatopsis xylanica]